MAIGSGIFLSKCFISRFGLITLSAILISILAFNSFSELQKVISWTPIYWLKGEVTEIEWLSRVGYNGNKAMPQMVGQVNRLIEKQSGPTPEDTILMVGASHGDLLNCHYLPDTSWNAQRFLGYILRSKGDYSALRELLIKDQIEYLLIDRAFISWIVENVPQLHRRGLATAMYHFTSFVSQHGEIILQVRKEDEVLVQLFRIKS